MTKAKRFFKSIKPWVRVVLFVGGAGAAGGGVIWQFGPYLTVSCFHLDGAQVDKMLFNSCEIRRQ